MIERINSDRDHITWMGIVDGYLKVVKRDAPVGIDNSINTHAEDIFWGFKGRFDRELPKQRLLLR